MEELYAELLLWFEGFFSGERYHSLLDEKFLEEPENDLYLELEECSTKLLDTLGRFKRYWDYEYSDFDRELFGRKLFSGLQHAYDTDIFEIADFGNRCCQLWHQLPSGIDDLEPFHTLIYGDDPLSWGDEEQTRMLYEKAFAFYDNSYLDHQTVAPNANRS